MNEIRKLPILEYMLYRRDAWISNLKQTEQGKEFLKTLWRLKQTTASENTKEFNKVVE